MLGVICEGFVAALGQRSLLIKVLVVDWISANSRPISIAEDAGLKQLFGYIEPAISLLCVI